LPLEEEPSARCFEQGRKISRLRYRMTQLAVSKGGWIIERKWKALSPEERSGQILNALDTVSQAAGPGGGAMRM